MGNGIAHVFAQSGYEVNLIDVSEEARKLKGSKPADLKTKKELEALSSKQVADAIPRGVRSLVRRRVPLSSLRARS